MAEAKSDRDLPDGDPATGGPRPAAPDLVPSRRQYLDLKRLHPDAILLYRLGDFYESFDEDAQVVARDVRITLTSRSFGRSGRVPMAGIPYHALNHYLARLLAAGHTIAIAEQLTEPGRGLVERAVTRVITPGTIADTALLPPDENRYLAALCAHGEQTGLAWVDVSTGEFATMEFGGHRKVEQLRGELARLNPAECLISAENPPDLTPPCHLTPVERWHFDPARAQATLCDQFEAQSLVPYGCADFAAATGAAGAIVNYVARTNPRLLSLLSGLRTEAPDDRVGLDAATRRNLELTRSFGTGGRRGSLLSVVDSTQTAQGARQLRQLLGAPLRNRDEIERRQALVGALAERGPLRVELARALRTVGDLERLVSKISQRLTTARDLLALSATLGVLPEIAHMLEQSGSPAVVNYARSLDPCTELHLSLANAIDADETAGARIRPGYCASLDAATDNARHIRCWFTELERTERERTGIRSLKVSYNKVFGYYLEISRPNIHLVPAEYVRKQTIATGERFITAELRAAEARLSVIDEEIATRERTLLDELSDEVVTMVGRLLATARRLAMVDALLSLAEVAARENWVRPELNDGDYLDIAGGRHPVVEAGLAGEPFMPNDCRLGGDEPRLLLVTGPNMGGKSTYLRQVAVIVLLAQIGSYVPAQSARIGLVDRIFTRVGAQDDLARGSSTFMIEMIETATILHQASRRSLVILDEVGRGTSTDDGLAIARAVVEDLHTRVGARTLFATHYLELTGLADYVPDIGNVHVAALEADDRVIFLYNVRKGPADRAYGIQVARLAGLPPWVADRAEAVLASLPESKPQANGHRADETPPPIQRIAEDDAPYQLALDGFKTGPTTADRIARGLRELDLARLTPREAIDWLFEQQSQL
ncbi:MAG: DNA mismatch repair protein MutS [Thermomicrobiales bacterium]